jgi:hypothetical protein
MLKYIQNQNFTFMFCIIDMNFCTIKYDSVGGEKCNLYKILFGKP